MRHKTLHIRAFTGVLAALWFAGVQACAQTTIPASAALPSSQADTSKPGFIWNVYQVEAATPNGTQKSEEVLAGVYGPNVADPSAQGAAIAPAAAPSSPNVPISFEIATVINLDQSAADGGNFNPTDQMPGIPGTTGSMDNIAAEVLNWIEFPAAGVYELGVNSDDGFRTTLGGSSPKDKFGIAVGEFNGGRGAADTLFKVKIDQAGLYAMRTTWEEGGGGASIEIFSTKADGTKVLVNDTANGGLRSFRAVTGSSPVYVQKVIPVPGSTGVSFDTDIEVELVDGQGMAVDTTSVKLSLDASQVNAQVSKNAGVTSVKYVPA